MSIIMAFGCGLAFSLIVTICSPAIGQVSATQSVGTIESSGQGSVAVGQAIDSVIITEVKNIQTLVENKIDEQKYWSFMFASVAAVISIAVIIILLHRNTNHQNAVLQEFFNEKNMELQEKVYQRVRCALIASHDELLEIQDNISRIREEIENGHRVAPDGTTNKKNSLKVCINRSIKNQQKTTISVNDAELVYSMIEFLDRYSKVLPSRKKALASSLDES